MKRGLENVPYLIGLGRPSDAVEEHDATQSDKQSAGPKMIEGFHGLHCKNHHIPAKE